MEIVTVNKKIPTSPPPQDRKMARITSHSGKIRVYFRDGTSNAEVVNSRNSRMVKFLYRISGTNIRGKKNSLLISSQLTHIFPLSRCIFWGANFLQKQTRTCRTDVRSADGPASDSCDSNYWKLKYTSTSNKFIFRGRFSASKKRRRKSWLTHNPKHSFHMSEARAKKRKTFNKLDFVSRLQASRKPNTKWHTGAYIKKDGKVDITDPDGVT